MSRRSRRGGSSARGRRRRSAGGGRRTFRAPLLALLAALAIAAAVFAHARRDRDVDIPGIARTAYLDGMGRGACRDIVNTMQCAAAIERQVLPALGERAQRRGDALVLRLSGPDSVLLVSVPTGDPSDEPVYHLVGVLETGHYIVHGQRYEGDFYLLVDRTTGEETPIWARPLPSPDGNRILVASADYEAGYNPNGFQIWRLASRRLSLEWSYEPQQWGPVNAAWIDDASIRFVREEWCPGYTGICRTPAVLERREGAWAIRETGERRQVDAG